MADLRTPTIHCSSWHIYIFNFPDDHTISLTYVSLIANSGVDNGWFFVVRGYLAIHKTVNEKPSAWIDLLYWDFQRCNYCVEISFNREKFEFEDYFKELYSRRMRTTRRWIHIIPFLSNNPNYRGNLIKTLHFSKVLRGKSIHASLLQI